jgi:hypothetical protein
MIHVARKRLHLVIITACWILVAVFAEFFILTNLDHDCKGELCTICLHIDIAQRLCEGLGRICIIAGLALVTLRSHALLELIIRRPAPPTLVRLKVKCSF